MINTAIIITIGDELLIGQTIDTNSAWIAKELNKAGIEVLQRIAIADEQQAIIKALDENIPQTGLIIMTGGLGPTSDDITKPTLSHYFGGHLTLNKTVFAHIQALYKKRDRPVLIEQVKKQAEIPDYCTLLMNKIGTAPGMWFEKEDCIIISLPGVPFEMAHIMEAEALPRLKTRRTGWHIVHQHLVTAGVGESIIAEKIKDLEAALPEEIHIAYLPSPGMVKIRLSSSGSNEETLRAATQKHSNIIAERLGHMVVAREDISLEEVLQQLILRKNYTLGLAESCTGGLVSNRITNIPGSSRFFKGALITYANQAKRRLLLVPKTTLKTQGAVSEATVIQMAEQARKTLKSTIALSISGILGPDGGNDIKPAGTVWMALAAKGSKTMTQKFYFPYGRLQNKEMAANAALVLLIQFLKTA